MIKRFKNSLGYRYLDDSMRKYIIKEILKKNVFLIEALQQILDDEDFYKAAMAKGLHQIQNMALNNAFKEIEVQDRVEESSNLDILINNI